MMRLILESIFITVILVGFFSVGYLLGDGTLLQPTYSPESGVNTSFDKSMNETDIRDVNRLLSTVDPMYLSLNKNIHFSKDRKSLNLDSKICKEAYGEVGCGGLNTAGHISIYWKYGREYILCHELLHDFIKIEENKASIIDGEWIYEDMNHNIIADLANKGVCFK